MKEGNRSGIRSVWILVAAAGGFIGALATLPVPDSAAAPGQEVPESRFAIVDVTLFDGEAFRRNQDVWIEEGRVSRVGERLRLPDDLPRVDGRGHTLLPGLIDGHYHTTGGALGDAVRFGVTSVLDQFSDPGLIPGAKTARDEIARTAEADLFSAGMLATAPGGHGTQFGMAMETLTEPAAAAAWVRARKAEGSDWIKIVSEDGAAYGGTFQMPALDRETIGALIAAAHAEGLRAVVHVTGMERALDAVSLGADGLVHVWIDGVISEEDARGFAEAGVFVVPTLSVITGMFGDSTGLRILAATDDSLVSPAQRQTLTGAMSFGGGPGGTVAIENVRRLHAAGVRVLAGTDVPNPGTAAGLSMHGELRLLARAGLESAEVLAAATSRAAEAFGVPERGRIAEGYVADLVLVRGDVERDVSHTTDIATIWKDGYAIARRAAAEPIAEIAPAPEGPIIIDFEDGIDSGFGFGWQTTTDAMNGGTSMADLAVEAGALVVRGETKAGFPFPWAGAIWFTGPQPLRAVDFSGRTTLRFRVRGDARPYTVMLFGAGAAGTTVPPMVPFTAGPEWAVVEIPLESFATADPSVIAGLAFVAQAPLGSFTLELDDVEIR